MRHAKAEQYAATDHERPLQPRGRRDAEASLYAGGPDTALDVIRSLPEEAETVLVIGHNPTVASLAQLLDDGEGDDEAIAEMSLGFPAGALCVFEYDGAWDDLDHGTARVTGFYNGKG